MAFLLRESSQPTAIPAEDMVARLGYIAQNLAECETMTHHDQFRKMSNHPQNYFYLHHLKVHSRHTETI